MSVLRRIQLSFLRLYVAAVVVQVYVAGLALFGAATFGPHAILGYALIIGALILLVLTAVARLPLRASLFALLIVLLAVSQPMLIWVVRPRAPALAALHPVNAVLIVVLGLLIARSAPRPA